MTYTTKDIIRISILFCLLLIPIIYALFTASDLSYSLLKRTAYLVTVIVCLLLPALFLKARTYFIVEGLLNFLFFPIDISSLYLNKQSTSAPFLQNIFHTNLNEAVEFLTSFWPICLGTIALWLIYFIIAIKIDNKFLFGSIFRKLILCSILVLFTIGTVTMMILLKRFHNERSIGSTFVDAVELVEMKFRKIYPYNLYIHSARLIQKQRKTNLLKDQVASFSFGIQPIHDISNELVILVIGEAARYDHFGLNGYQRNTTPYLAQQSHLITYDNVFSQANQTEYSVPILLTRATADSFDLAFSEKSLPEAFQEAGFWSGYISKQVSFDLTERIANSCNYSYFYAKDFDVDGNYDEHMLCKLRSQVLDTMQFFILHSLGSHFRYEHRYPHSFDYFLPILGRSASYALLNEENRDKLINAYDNSILYTDYFLHELITYVDSLNKSAIIVYISDHGESFWDDEHKLSLHGSYLISKYEYHVPMVAWYSDEYETLHPTKVQNIRNNKTKHISSEVIFYSLMDMAGITDIVDSTLSVSSQDLQSLDSIWIHTGAGDVVRTPISGLVK